MPESGRLPPHSPWDASNYRTDDTRAPAPSPWTNALPATAARTLPDQAGRGFRLWSRLFMGVALLSSIGVIAGIITGHSAARVALYGAIALCIAAVLREIAYLKRSVADREPGPVTFPTSRKRQ